MAIIYKFLSIIEGNYLYFISKALKLIMVWQPVASCIVRA